MRLLCAFGDGRRGALKATGEQRGGTFDRRKCNLILYVICSQRGESTCYSSGSNLKRDQGSTFDSVYFVFALQASRLFNRLQIKSDVAGRRGEFFKNLDIRYQAEAESRHPATAPGLLHQGKRVLLKVKRVEDVVKRQRRTFIFLSE